MRKTNFTTRLLGQVHSYDDKEKILNIFPGSKTIDKTKIPRYDVDLIKGLVLLNGCLPVHHLNPGMHHFGHYGGYTDTYGLLTILWMMGFERFVSCGLILLSLNTHTHTQVQQVLEELAP